MSWAGPPIERNHCPYGNGHYNYPEEEEEYCSHLDIGQMTQ